MQSRAAKAFSLKRSAHSAVLQVRSTRARQAAHPQQVISGTHQPCVNLNACRAAHHGFTEPAIGLHPTEDLLYALAFLLARRIARVTRSASVEPWRNAPWDDRNVRRDIVAAQVSHKCFRVVALVSAEAAQSNAFSALSVDQCLRRWRLGFERRTDADVHAQTVAILHQRVSAEAQLRFFAGCLAPQLRIRIGCRSVSLVATLLTPEIDATVIIRARRRRWAVFMLEALHRSP